MRPSDRTIRDELRREAARVTIPSNMWDNIQRRLDSDMEAADRRKRLATGRAQWKPAIVFAAAAGIFWLTIIPINASMDSVQPNDPLTAPVNRTVVQPDPARNRQISTEIERPQGTAQAAGSTQQDRALNSPHTFYNMPTRY